MASFDSVRAPHLGIWLEFRQKPLCSWSRGLIGAIRPKEWRRKANFTGSSASGSWPKFEVRSWLGRDFLNLDGRESIGLHGLTQEREHEVSPFEGDREILPIGGRPLASLHASSRSLWSSIGVFLEFSFSKPFSLVVLTRTLSSSYLGVKICL